MIIEIVCVVSPHGKQFAEFLRKTGEALKSSEHEIEWRCVIDKGSPIPDGFSCIHKLSPVRGKARNHAAGLNFGAKLFNSDCVAFMDSDIALLYKGWDAVMVDHLGRCDSFGVSHKHDFYRYHNYPVCQFMAFSGRAMRDIDWNFLPEKKNKGLAKYVATEDDSKICDVPVGTILKKDTSWRVPYLLHEKGYTKSFVMDLVSVVSKKTLMPFFSKKEKSICYKICSDKIISGTTRMAEYHYNREAYCTHFGRSRKVISVNKEQTIWTNRVKLHLEQKYGIAL